MHEQGVVEVGGMNGGANSSRQALPERCFAAHTRWVNRIKICKQREGGRWMGAGQHVIQNSHSAGKKKQEKEGVSLGWRFIGIEKANLLR